MSVYIVKYYRFATGKSFEDLKQFEKDEKLCGRIATVPNALCVLRYFIFRFLWYISFFL